MKFIFSFLLFFASITLSAKDFYFEATYQGDFIAEKFNHKNSLGLEYFRKFSNDFGDFLTTNLQLRVPYNLEGEFPESLTLEIHNAWLEYKAGLGKYLRIGHFAPAFGLEHKTDTHGTLHQTSAMKNVGFKQDWGIGYRSFIGHFDYAVAVQTGSGMALRKDGFLYSGRIASPTVNDFRYAFSALYGDVHKVMSMATYPAAESMGIITKRRIAAELQYNFGAYYFRNEFSAGYNEKKKIISNFAEFEFNPFTLQNFNFLLQSKYFRVEKNDPINWLTGTSYKFFDRLTLSFLYDLSEKIMLFKLYYFG